MTRICVYETATGRARWNTDCPDGMEDKQTEGPGLEGLAWVAVAEPVNGNTHHIVDGVVTPRPTMAGFDRLTIAAGGQEFARLVLDSPFLVTIDGDATAITEPDKAGRYVVEIGGMVPAVYRVAVDCWPFLPYTAEVVAA